MNTSVHSRVGFSNFYNMDDHKLWLSRLTRVDAWQYSVPLTRGIKTPQHVINHRNGILLRWQFEDRCMYSDLCPLSGFNTETLDLAFLQLKKALVDPSCELSPSVDLAIFSARFQYEHSEINLVDGVKTADIPNLCYLLSPDDDVPTQGIADNCIKVKIGQTTIEQDINRIHLVCEQLNKNQKIRLDANGQLNHENLDRLFSNIDLDLIDYIEDPFSNVEDYKHWSDRYSVAFAWDDLANQWNSKLALEYQPEALIIKPLFLGFRQAWTMALAAQSCNVQVVFSSAYESSLNNQLYAQLANLLNLDTPQGLDTDKYWAHSLLAPPLRERLSGQQYKHGLQLSDMEFRGTLL